MSLEKCPVRLRNITATEMAALFGLNPYSSPAKVLENKLHPTVVDNNHVRRGKLKEPSVIEAFRMDAKLDAIRHEEGTMELPQFRIAATPDAFVNGTKTVVECKSIMSTSFDKWYDSIPTYYHMQVLTQILVVGGSEGYIGALEEGDPRECEYRFIAWKVDRNEEVEELMKQEVARFWQHVDEGKTYRVNSKVKKQVSEILPSTSKLFVPTEKPRRVNEQSLSDILALFE